MKILRWTLIAALATVFLLLSVSNWTEVKFVLPDSTERLIPLPILLGIAFLAGWLPAWLTHLGAKTTLKRKLARYERADDPAAPHTSALPSQAQPTIVPPAGA